MILLTMETKPLYNKIVDNGNKMIVYQNYCNGNNKGDNMTKEEKLSIIFNKVTERHGVINNLSEIKFITEYKILEVHFIDLIEKIQDANVTKISKAFEMTRGAISKIAKRLIKAGTIETYQNPENKKEIYYKLTDIGRDIYLKHEKMHQNRIDRDSLLFSELKEEEKDYLINIFKNIEMNLENELKKFGLDVYMNNIE